MRTRLQVAGRRKILHAPDIEEAGRGERCHHRLTEFPFPVLFYSRTGAGVVHDQRRWSSIGQKSTGSFVFSYASRMGYGLADGFVSESQETLSVRSLGKGRRRVSRRAARDRGSKTRLGAISSPIPTVRRRCLDRARGLNILVIGRRLHHLCGRIREHTHGLVLPYRAGSG